MKKLIACLPLTALACAAPPLGAPDQTAQRIAAAIEEGDPNAASRLFARAESPDYRERMYPVLYTQAANDYEAGDTAGSAEVLRFMHEHYPDSDAVAEALLYSLFLERASGGPTGVDDEIDHVLADVTAADSTPPIWVDLLRTQRAIDRERLAEAREAYARFLEAWDGRPTALAVYVEDLGRYLTQDDPPTRTAMGGAQ